MKRIGIVLAFVLVVALLCFALAGFFTAPATMEAEAGGLASISAVSAIAMEVGAPLGIAGGSPALATYEGTAIGTIESTSSNYIAILSTGLIWAITALTLVGLAMLVTPLTVRGRFGRTLLNLKFPHPA